MMGQVADGRAVSKKIQDALRAELEAFNARGLRPKLAVLWAGDDPASGYYFRAKERLAGELGILFDGRHLDGGVSEAKFFQTLADLNGDPSIHGILVEAPAPRSVNAKLIPEMLSPEKDVDGITLISQGRLLAGQEAFIPATPLGVMRLLEAYGIGPAGKHAVVVGRSEVVGKPLALLLLKANATVTICHSRTQDLKSHTLSADIICAAAGVPQLVTGEMVKSGAVVIDIGYNALEDGQIVGDVDFESVSRQASLITPVKGGVGAMTATMIMANTIDAAKRIHNRQTV